MRTRTKLTTVLASGTLAAGLLVGGASSASAGTAQTCYGGAVDFSTTNKVWPAYPQWRTTSARCADVNVKATVGAYVQACFYQAPANRTSATPSGGSRRACGTRP